MIFITVGSQQYQFNRILRAMDELIESGSIKDKVFAQTGSSNYEPQNYPFEHFIGSEEYQKQVKTSDIVIAHGGTGAIVGALKAGKQVVAVPRQSKYGEHADDHQFQICDFMKENGYVFEVIEMSNLLEAIESAKIKPKMKRFTGSGNVLGIIDKYIQSETEQS